MFNPRSNWTFMELKHGQRPSVSTGEVSSNWTFMELKLLCRSELIDKAVLF